MQSQTGILFYYLQFFPSSNQKTKFHVSQTLSYKNGYSLPFKPHVGVGGDPLPVKEVWLYFFVFSWSIHGSA